MDRRDFLKGSVAASAAGAMIGMSYEEKALLAKSSSTPVEAIKPGKMAMGKIGDMEISRIICGGNLIGGYAHSRDLIYVSPLLMHYFTDDKIMETWAICEKNGINACTIFSGNANAVQLFKRYKKEYGSKMKFLSQTGAEANTIEKSVDEAMDAGASAIYLVGNQGDRWVFDNRLDLIEKFVEYVKKQGVPAGIAGHSLQMPIAIESAGIDVDFYFKTMHSVNYWSSRREGQNKEVIENYGTDNYWDMTPPETIDFMKDVKKPWIAYKVLAAGAIHPRDGFEYAFKNGADFACVGMFDWQIAEDAQLATEIVAKHAGRARTWRA